MMAAGDRFSQSLDRCSRRCSIGKWVARRSGNLASILLQRGKREEVLPIIMHAVELDPGDVLNEVILNQVRGPLPRGDESIDESFDTTNSYLEPQRAR